MPNASTNLWSQGGKALVTILSERISRSFRLISHRKFSVVNTGPHLSSALATRSQCIRTPVI